MKPPPLAALLLAAAWEEGILWHTSLESTEETNNMNNPQQDKGKRGDRTRGIPGLCLLSVQPRPLCPQTRFHQCRSRFPEIISDIYVRKRSSSHVSSFPILNIDIPDKINEPIDAKGCVSGYFWRSWLFVQLYFPPFWQYVCEFQTSLTVNQHSVIDETVLHEEGRLFRKSGIVSTVFSQEERLWYLWLF